MGYETRPIAEIEIPAFLRADGVAFGFEPSDEDMDLARSSLGLDRSLAAFDGDRIVGTAGDQNSSSM